MLRLCNRASSSPLRLHLRTALSSSTRSNSIQTPSKVNNSHILPPPSSPPILHREPALLPSPSPSRNTLIALSAALISAIAASYALIASQEDENAFDYRGWAVRVYGELENAVDRSSESFKKILGRMKQTGTAATVLWKSLRSVMSSANHEVRAGFELRVASLLADIAAANESRRAALVGAGGGAVVDWLLETVALSGDSVGTQAESARALAYLISDPNVCDSVLGRPRAVPFLLRFIFSAQPRGSKNQRRRSSLAISDSLKGRSMLVTAIMDVVTSNCDSTDRVFFKPLLPKNAEMRDIAAAIEVLEEGGMQWDEPHGSDDSDDGGKGMKGIGIKILEGTTALGLSRTNEIFDMEGSNTSHLMKTKYKPSNLLLNRMTESFLGQANMSSAVVPGLWDDLHSEHVAVPFAAWALANWAMASEVNRSHIQELDGNGHAVMSALMAPERSVKWHGSLVARLLLEYRNLPLNGSVTDWSSTLLSTLFQASKSQDMPLAQVALSAFLISIERSPNAKEVAMDEGLYMMRQTAKNTMNHRPVQEALARALELLCTGEMHLPLEESQKWSGILLPWIFGKHSSNKMRSSAINILSRILEDYGPSSIPISQGWLAILLTDILSSRKTTLTKGNAQIENDKVKTQVDQSNIVSATLVANQLAAAVVNLAGMQLGKVTDDDDSFPLADLLSLEPFSLQFKNLKKDKTRIDAADSALATLKGIKSLTEICAEDTSCQNRLADFGVLCLLRRHLLEDDYEQLAAIEAYDASRAPETPEWASSVPGESRAANTNEPSSLRVPSTSHLRRHAARLLTVLSANPKIQKAIAADQTWCKWLEECAEGKIPGCNDLKIQSYARATLLNVFCNDQRDRDSSVNDANVTCLRYADMIFLINPEQSHWKCPKRIIQKSTDELQPTTDAPCRTEHVPSTSNLSDDSSSCAFQKNLVPGNPPLDVVFVHGLRGGPFKTWRLSEDKASTKSGLVEKIDEEAGKQGTFWPGEWLSADLPGARLFSIKYKTNLTQWSGASLPLQEVSSMLLEKLVTAGIGNRPVVFVTHSMGGLVVKQMLYEAKAKNRDDLINNTIGVVFYSCPHFGSKLADMPWRMGFMLRPAPTIGELRSGSPRLVELNDFIHHLHKKGTLDVLSFCETKVTPIVEGYGGWAFRMEIVPLESAYPGFGELVVLESTDHINSCKPLSRSDPSYKETLDFLHKLKAHYP